MKIYLQNAEVSYNCLCISLKTKIGHVFCSTWFGVFFTHRISSAIKWLRNADFLPQQMQCNCPQFRKIALFFPNCPPPFYFGVEYKNIFSETLVDFPSECMKLTFNCNSVHEARGLHSI